MITILFQHSRKTAISEDDPNVGQDHEYKTWNFPSGELGLQLMGFAPSYKKCYVTAKITTPQEIMELMLVVDALRNQHEGELHLDIPYIPFGRQDRHTPGDAPFSLRVMANMINMCKFDTVTTMTPHSNVTEFLIDNLIVKEPIDYFRNYLLSHKLATMGEGTATFRPHPDVIVVAPDAGAEKRSYKIAEELRIPDVYVCSKRRNAHTGDIIGMVASGDMPEGKHMIVLDDICDGGRTFIELAKVLPTNRQSLHLLITHGIFSKGRVILNQAGYDGVYAVHNFIEERLNR